IQSRAGTLLQCVHMLSVIKTSRPPDQHRVTTSPPRLDLHKALRPNTLMAPGNQQLLLIQSRAGTLLQCVHMLSVIKTSRPPDQHRVTTSPPRLDLHKALWPNTLMAPGNQQLLLSRSRAGTLLQCLYMLSLSKTSRPRAQHSTTPRPHT